MFRADTGGEARPCPRLHGLERDQVHGRGADEARGNFTVFHAATPASMETLLKAQRNGEARPLPGVGEEAWTMDRDSGLKIRDYAVGVRKANWLFVFNATQGHFKVPCTLDQMVEVGKLAISRLP